MHNTLLLGSTSASRQMLLTQAQIPFKTVAQSADESKCDWSLSLSSVVESIAVYKMDAIVIPAGIEGEYCYVLTADTLGEDSCGAIHGKPTSREDAVVKIKAARGGMRTGTAFCLDRKIFHNGQWRTEQRIVRYVVAEYQFIIPDDWIDYYLDNSPALQVSGAIAIEGLGGLFLRSIQGSYSTIVGLPLYEVREALQEIGFFKK